MIINNNVFHSPLAESQQHQFDTCLLHPGALSLLYFSVQLKIQEKNNYNKLGIHVKLFIKRCEQQKYLWNDIECVVKKKPIRGEKTTL